MNTNTTPAPTAETAGSDAKRFWDKVLKSESSCWNWIGAKADGRYGVIYLERKYQLAHRVSWKMHFGDIPAEMKVLHRCDNGLCVNPAHLFLGTLKDNSQDMVKKGRAKNGTALSEINVRTIRSVPGIPRTELARYFGVSPQTIAKIQRMKTWKHVVTKQKKP